MAGDYLLGRRELRRVGVALQRHISAGGARGAAECHCASVVDAVVLEVGAGIVDERAAREGRRAVGMHVRHPAVAAGRCVVDKGAAREGRRTT